MPDPVSKSLDRPEETIEFPSAVATMVELGDLTIGQIVTEPGWRWSTHIRPKVGGEWCQARHVGIIVTGLARARHPGSRDRLSRRSASSQHDARRLHAHDAA